MGGLDRGAVGPWVDSIAERSGLPVKIDNHHPGLRPHPASLPERRARS